MGDFKAIETQEQFDEAIKERLKRERDNIAKKYEGYISPEDFEVKTKEFETRITDADKALKEANEKISGHEKELEERDSKIKGYESASVKTRIAHEVGLSYDAVKFIQGEDEEGIRKSAESLKALVGSSAPLPPLADNQTGGQDEDAALRNTLRNLKKGE